MRRCNPEAETLSLGREEKHHIEQCNLIGAKENAKTFLDRRTEGGINISDELYKTLLRQIDECYEQFSEELLLGYSV